MSWFKSKPRKPTRPAYLDRPDDPDAYPEEEKQILRAIPQMFSQCLAEEAAVLTQHGLPVPTPISTQTRFEPKIKYSELNEGHYWLQTVKVYLPQFEIPPYCTFNVFEKLRYTVTGDQQYVEAAKTDLASHGFTYLIEHYPGIWTETERDPYNFSGSSLFQMGRWKSSLPAIKYAIVIRFLAVR